MAFDRVLVPLDGSRSAEASLPMARALAQTLGSELVLVHALEQSPPQEVHGEPHLVTRAAAQTYLDAQRDQLRADGLRAETHVIVSPDEDVAQAIAQLAERFATDLVAMCAHGRRTLRGRFLGPIAQQALRRGGPPILLRTAGASPEVPAEVRHILVPVDFRHDLEPTMVQLGSLAQGFDADVTLLHAVDAGATGLPARMLPNVSLELSERARRAARERLNELADRLRAKGIRAEVVVSTEDPEDAIIRRARDADLIILVTHARSGVAAWYERSVGRVVVSEPDLTLLLYRGSATGPQRLSPHPSRSKDMR